jgi:hypothetical protein
MDPIVMPGRYDKHDPATWRRPSGMAGPAR